ncbi:hypothetical protein PC129_g6257 [Phytophthora cactorum]|uniref:Uncharacterized protein n=1 Tax=Phytophthora cactorum TaxID=29920 RepID=A0A8T1E0A6_9STRA|nr:hypothetical protein Pcac1_g17461 [Phytophthora cactorum]KAG2912948.1 hypothetical protein PC114_g8722 [Phytophthora cactorum]KAG2944572.1 hypothetical protein PC117_g8991 [Phytophthora cactorum]KAG3023744.1 hypothetical protein PC119_g8783 [Phytophthora cactorum]KAG3027907.1 hypothetical protein PC120_g5154 [Phytophthora cactorum]
MDSTLIFDISGAADGLGVLPSVPDRRDRRGPRFAAVERTTR